MISNLNSNQQLSFKGYDARKLSAVFMKMCTKKQIPIAEELIGIGKKLDFDVFLQTRKSVYDSTKALKLGKQYKDFEKLLLLHKNLKKRKGKSSPALRGQLKKVHDRGKVDELLHRTVAPWAQDIQHFVQDNKLLNNILMIVPDTNGKIDCNTSRAFGDQNICSKLAKLLGINSKMMKSHVEGGNVFQGLKQNGEKYILIGSQSIKNTAKLNNVSVKKAKELISQDFLVDRKNIYVIPQPGFHIDLQIRPLKFPDILVNDQKASENLLESLIKDKNTPPDLKLKYQEMLDISKKYMNPKYADSDKIVQVLKKQGFNPIKIPAVFGDADESAQWMLDKEKNVHLANYMNAIVQEDSHGNMHYITNSCGLDKLNKIFKENLKKLNLKINDVFFVSGDVLDNGHTSTESFLRRNRGGLHCMVTERADLVK